MKIMNVKLEFYDNFKFDSKAEFDFKEYFWSKPIKMTCFKWAKENYITSNIKQAHWDWVNLKTGIVCSYKLSSLLCDEYYAVKHKEECVKRRQELEKLK